MFLSHSQFLRLGVSGTAAKLSLHGGTDAHIYTDVLSYLSVQVASGMHLLLLLSLLHSSDRV